MPRISTEVIKTHLIYQANRYNWECHLDHTLGLGEVSPSVRLRQQSVNDVQIASNWVGLLAIQSRCCCCWQAGSTVRCDVTHSSIVKSRAYWARSTSTSSNPTTAFDYQYVVSWSPGRTRRQAGQPSDVTWPGRSSRTEAQLIETARLGAWMGWRWRLRASNDSPVKYNVRSSVITARPTV